MKKQSRKKTASRQARPVSLPLLTDPHLVALLSYMDGGEGGEDDASFTRANQVAMAMLTSLPLTTAYDMINGRPVLYDLICDYMLEDARRWTDHEDHRAVILTASYRDEHGWGGPDPDEPVTIGRRADLQFVTHMFAERSVFVGACLMYHLLKGDVR